MKKTLLWAAVLAVATGPAFAAVVINESLVDTGGGDIGEFVELYDGGASTDISNWQVVLVNGANGFAYNTITIPAATTMPGDGYYVIGDATSIDAAFGAGTVDNNTNLNNGIQNGSPDAIVLYDNTATRMDSFNYEADAVFGAGPASPDATAEGGYGLDRTGDTLAVNQRLSTIGRLPDGTDTDDNFVDFREIDATPGTANAINTTLPLTENFTGPASGNRWFDPFSATPFTSTAASEGIVASSDGGGILRCVDTTGGGRAEYVLGDFSTLNFTGEIYIPADAAAGREASMGLGIMTDNEGSWFNGAVGNALENGYYLEYQNGAPVGLPNIPDHAGVFDFFSYESAGTIGTGSSAGTFTLLGSYTVPGGEKAAWATFRLFYGAGSNQLYAAINGNVLYNGTIPANTCNTSGGISVGYRENHAGTPTATGEATFVDGVTLNTDGTGVPVELSVFETN